MRLMTGACLLGAIAIVHADPTGPGAAPFTSEALAKALEQCQSEASSAYGMPAIDATKGRGMPRKTREVAPKTKAQGRWAGLALLAPDGKVRDVWKLTAVNDDDDKAVADAVRKWKYESAVSDGQKVPVCFLVIINLR